MWRHEWIKVAKSVVIYVSLRSYVRRCRSRRELSLGGHCIAGSYQGGNSVSVIAISNGLDDFSKLGLSVAQNDGLRRWLEAMRTK